MNCPSCGKPLRSDNTRGACAKCINSGKAPRVTAQISTRKRFAVAAGAMGLDAAALVEGFMAAWLSGQGR